MERSGDDLAGFSVHHDTVAGKAEVRAWGSWSPALALSFATKVSASFRERAAPVELVLDVRNLRPLSEDAQQSFANLIRALRGLGVTRLSVAATSHMMKLQLQRITSGAGRGIAVEWQGAVLDRPELSRSSH